MNYLGFGLGRVVFSIDENTIVKIPYNQRGIEQNQEEFSTYDNTKPYGEVFKIENNILHMELLDVCAELFNDFVFDRIHCTLYDDSTEKTIELNCDKNCAECEHNACIGLFNEEETKTILDNAIESKNIQVGRDKNGILKIYDYASTSGNCDLIFYDELVPLFLEYYEEHPTLDVLFCDWVKDKELPTQVFDINVLYKNANKQKRRKYTN